MQGSLQNQSKAVEHLEASVGELADTVDEQV